MDRALHTVATAVNVYDMAFNSRAGGGGVGLGMYFGGALTNSALYNILAASGLLPCRAADTVLSFYIGSNLWWVLFSAIRGRRTYWRTLPLAAVAGAAMVVQLFETKYITAVAAVIHALASLELNTQNIRSGVYD